MVNDNRNFKIPKQNWKSFPIDSLKFILDEGKEYLNYTIVESDKITNRAYSLIILLSTILATIVAFTFSKMVANDISTTITMMNLYLSFVISFIIIYLFGLVFPRTIMAKGRIPSALAQEKLLLNANLSGEEIYLSFIIREIEDIQDKIDFNLSKNNSRRDKLKVVIYLIAILLPVYLLISYLVFN